MRTINESTEENVAAECSSALRGAEVIPPPPQPPPSCHPVLPCLSRLHLAPQTSNEYHPPPPPHGNRRSDEQEPLEFAEPEPTSVSLKRPLSFDANRCQSCVYSDGPNPSSTLLRGCEACTEAGDGEIVPFRGIVRKGFDRGRIASIFRYLWGRFDRCAIWNYD